MGKLGGCWGGSVAISRRGEYFGTQRSESAFKGPLTGRCVWFVAFRFGARGAIFRVGFGWLVVLKGW